MAESARQKRITGRVMHEFKHGELKSGPGGKGSTVKSRKQAIAIALEEAGDSNRESDSRNARNLFGLSYGGGAGKLRYHEDVCRDLAPFSYRTGAVLCGRVDRAHGDPVACFDRPAHSGPKAAVAR